MERARAGDGGYLAATVGAVMGGIGLSITAACVGSSLGAGTESGTGLFVSPFSGQLIGMLLGFLLGLMIGEPLGCWLALRRAGYRNAGATASLLAVLMLSGLYVQNMILFYPIVDTFFVPYFRNPSAGYVYHGAQVVLLLVAYPPLARLAANWLWPVSHDATTDLRNHA